MAITNPQDFIQDDFNFIRSTFIVSLGQDFESYAAMVAYASVDERYGQGTPAIDPNMADLLSKIGPDQPIPAYFSRRKCRDTSLGGNDAINCLYGYNENDDIVHPFTMTDFGFSGQGRVYSETIDDNQQLLYLRFGVPVFNSITGFYSDMVVPEMASLMNKGSRTEILAGIGELLGQTVTTFFLLPVVPLLFAERILDGLKSVKITKYYDFAVDLPLYYRMVNGILVHLAVNMGLANDAKILGKIGGEVFGFDLSVDLEQMFRVRGVAQERGGPIAAMSHDERMAATRAAEGKGGDGRGLPEVFQQNGFDIYRIVNRKYLYELGINPADLGSTDQALLENMREAAGTTVPNSNSQGRTWTRTLVDSWKNSLYDGQMFVGFRIEKSSSPTESISNSTGPSEIAEAINSKVQAARNFSFSAMGGNFSNSMIGDTIEGILGAVGAFAKGAASVAGLSGVTAVMTGSALIDIPEVWTGSSFSRDYSFHLSLRSPYAHPVSIMQDCYVPLAMLLAGTLPRAAGPTSYISPFLVQAYSKGLFAVPLGIIDSMTIRRGAETHGMSFQRLPMVVDVDFTIKDLSPALYVALGDNSLWQETFGQTSSFQEYLLTLSGMGLRERMTGMGSLRRRAQRFLATLFTTKLNPNYWGIENGNRLPSRMISAVLPTTAIPTN